MRLAQLLAFVGLGVAAALALVGDFRGAAIIGGLAAAGLAAQFWAPSVGDPSRAAVHAMVMAGFSLGGLGWAVALMVMGHHLVVAALLLLAGLCWGYLGFGVFTLWQRSSGE